MNDKVIYPLPCGPDSTKELITTRGQTHGDFTAHAEYTQRIKQVLHSSPNWLRMSNAQRESLEMNAHKVGRILAGDPDFRDHWDDIAGYARLVAERCSK